MAWLKGLVSKNKRRYQEDGFNLDLSYVRDNVIAMGYPSEGKEATYRNPYSEVVKLLDMKHKDHYRVYNLCAEKCYDSATHFHGSVVRYPHYDHHPPPAEMMLRFCLDVDAYLKEDPANVVAVHCKAGKGRTGVMICAYLIYSGIWRTPAQALEFYGHARTMDGKGVTIPSQKRYVHYMYEIVTRMNKQLVPRTLLLVRLRMHSFPKASNCHPFFQIFIKKTMVYKSDALKPPAKVERGNAFDFEVPNVPLCGDIQVQFLDNKTLQAAKMFRFYIHTSFVTEGNVTLRKSELDVACKDKHDKIYPKSFMIEMTFQELDAGVTYDMVPHTAVHLHDEEEADEVVDDPTYGESGEEEEDGDTPFSPRGLAPTNNTSDAPMSPREEQRRIKLMAVTESKNDEVVWACVDDAVHVEEKKEEEEETDAV